MSEIIDQQIIMALPKGRILQELIPRLEQYDIIISPEFLDDSSRKLIFDTNLSYLKVIQCRSYDAASFVSYGSADIGICGIDVIKEFAYRNIYQMLNLNIAKCRLSIAGIKDNYDMSKKLTIASKYPALTNRFFKEKSIDVNIIKLNGSIEVAVKLGLCDYIVDLVSTGNTLRENGLVEIEKIFDVSSQLIVNKNSLVTKNKMIVELINRFAND